MKFESLKKLDNNNIANTYARFDVAIEKGSGSFLYDTEGNEYIDFTSGIGVNSFGACDKKWQNAVTKQVKTLSHISNLYYTLPQTKLAKMICDKTEMNKVFFANSGAEANEGAIKCARKYSYDKYGDKRFEIITLVNSFHGRTIATLTATGQDNFHKYFGPFLDGFKYAKANDIDDLKKQLSKKTCAIMIELVQGEGGVVPLDMGYVHELVEICEKNDILLIVDEVQTGNGRTGFLYSYMAYDIKPDIVTTAKGLAGGLPFGAIIMGEKCKNTFDHGSHGSTFGGNPIAAAGALSIFARLDENFLKEVREKEKIVYKILNSCKNVQNVTGMGLMIGVELKKKDAKEVLKECINKKLLILTAKEKVRLLPPLNIDKKTLENGLNILKEVINK
jgi:acetylornithine/N-succinyldiaminopimelate aminotransferase